ncbi:NfeD family protein, partial [Crocosphaera sp.]
RVMYEGNSWQAICADPTMLISPHQKVYIVNRKGNTLVVLPEFLPDSLDE